MTALCVLQSEHVMCSFPRHHVAPRRTAAQEGRHCSTGRVAHRRESKVAARTCQPRQSSKLGRAGLLQWQPKTVSKDEVVADAPPAGMALVAPAPANVPGVVAHVDQQGGSKAASPQHVEPASVEPSSAPKAEPPAAMDDREVLVRGVAIALTSMASLSKGPEQMTRFHCKYAPAMSIGDYIGRVRRFFGCEASCYVVALTYIDRLIKVKPEIVFSPLSSHRMIITAITLAAKFNEDTFYSNKYYAKVGGVPLRELNMLEHYFLQLIDWKLQVAPEEYEVYASLARQAATPKVANERQ